MYWVPISSRFIDKFNVNLQIFFSFKILRSAAQAMKVFFCESDLVIDALSKALLIIFMYACLTLPSKHHRFLTLPSESRSKTSSTACQVSALGTLEASGAKLQL